jgi:hypothetical protein
LGQAERSVILLFLQAGPPQNRKAFKKGCNYSNYGIYIDFTLMALTLADARDLP